MAKLTQNEVQERISIKSNNKVKIISEYNNLNSKNKMECLCGHIWEVSLKSYLQNKSICPNCESIAGGRLTQEEVELRILKILGDEYKLISLYKGKEEKITLKHSCGSEYKVWSNDIFTKWLGRCPDCNFKRSFGEQKIYEFLILNEIDYEEQKQFKDCYNTSKNRLLPFDFFIPEINLLIEFDGEQHFKPKFGEGLDGIEFNRTQENDKIKTDFAKNQHINLLRISFKEITSIDEILKRTFNDYRKDK